MTELRSGRLAAATNKDKYGSDFYIKIGAKGGATKGKPKGFAVMDKEKVRAAGRKGGGRSKRR